MAFRLEDFKKTTRKSADGSRAPASVYPHQMRDKKTLARLEIAIRTFDSLTGKRRGEMDAGAMADFFGDPRIARGVVACLGRFYQYKTPSFAEVVGTEAAQRLADAGLTHPRALRAHTFAHVNREHCGFLREAERAACYADIGRPFGLTAHEWDSLLHLDAEENQVLTRPGSVPTPADLAALYNFHSLDTPLRRATRIVLTGFSLTSTEAADVRALARALGVKVMVAEGRTVTLTDLEMSSLLPRRPGRLGRCLLHLIQAFGNKSLTGHADALLGTRPFRLALNHDTLTTLGLSSSPGMGGFIGVGRGAISFCRRFEAAGVLHKDLLKRRAQGEAAGWRIARLPDPVVTARGVLLPDFKLTRGGRSVYLVFGEIVSGEWDAPVIAVPLGRRAITAADLLARAQAETHNLLTPLERPLPDVPRDVRALCDRAAASGMVPAAEARRTLHLLDESPLIEWIRRAADPRVRYIPGIGLCSQELVAAIGQLQPPPATDLPS